MRSLGSSTDGGGVGQRKSAASLTRRRRAME